MNKRLVLFLYIDSLLLGLAAIGIGLYQIQLNRTDIPLPAIVCLSLCILFYAFGKIKERSN